MLKKLLKKIIQLLKKIKVVLIGETNYESKAYKKNVKELLKNETKKYEEKVLYLTKHLEQLVKHPLDYIFLQELLNMLDENPDTSTHIVITLNDGSKIDMFKEEKKAEVTNW
jgi:ABC-type uncharacterized transport system ATPase subunit